MPHFVADPSGETLRIVFLLEIGIAAAHHVEKDAVVGLVAVHMRVLGPMLRPQGPEVDAVVVIILRIVLVRAVVFQVEQHDVDAEAFAQGLVIELSGTFQQYAHTAGTVVGAVNGSVGVGRVGVVVGEGTRVPVGTKHDAFLGLWVEHRDDILSVNAPVIKQTCPEFLHDDRVGPLVQLGGEPLGTGDVSLCFGYARPKLGLLGHKLIGRIGIELRHDDRLSRFFRVILCSLGLLVAA